MAETLLEQDIYRISKEELITILQSYNVLVDSTDVVSTLRPIAALIKQIEKQAKDDPHLKLLIRKVTGRYAPLSVEQQINYPNLGRLEHILQNREHIYDEVAPDDAKEQNPEHDQSLYIEPLRPNEQVVQNEQPPIMAHENLPLISAGTFSGLPSENPNEFLEKFEVAASSNNWQTPTKIRLFPAHLSGTALSWYKLYKEKCGQNDIAWDALQEEFTKAFTPLPLAHNLQMIMENKIQRENEPTLTFFLDVINTCRRHEPNITEKQIIHYVIQGLKPQICEKILSMKNESLADFENNLKTAEIQVLTQTQNKLKYIRETKGNTQLDTDRDNVIHSLQTEIKTLANVVANLQVTNNDEGRRKYPSTQTTYQRRDHSQNRDSRLDRYHRSSTPNRVTFKDTRSAQQNRNTPQCAICKRSNHKTQQCWYYNTPQHNDHRNISQPRNNRPEKNYFCNYCKRTNHNIDTCFRSKYYQKRCYDTQKN